MPMRYKHHDDDELCSCDAHGGCLAAYGKHVPTDTTEKAQQPQPWPRPVSPCSPKAHVVERKLPQAPNPLHNSVFGARRDDDRSTTSVAAIDPVRMRCHANHGPRLEQIAEPEHAAEICLLV
ncbi:hypothetical protein BS50DRAFT_104845 [Corynespora cassiicola Philippines]|uniref:Uncharacterized protein n=1 Tax=Corynespora cassiicola Philippines TaxID=1448308 RepID=A0A2T2NCG6_CORCC|nr:hypothetical protein BS50DRAFT_104845 [Corynespora cassiicola Philippines]